MVAIAVHATGAPAFAAASSGGRLGSQCTARKRRPVTPAAASDSRDVGFRGERKQARSAILTLA